MIADPDATVALVAQVLARASAGPLAADLEVADEAPNWRHEACAVVAALDEAGLLLRPGAGGTSEHPELVQQVLDAGEVRRAHYALAAAAVDARIQRWVALGEAQERAKWLEGKGNE